ncbi:hypothetical protein BKP30_09755 [Rhodococcus erythropolis]|nr:hypothetical protein BKP30_09755 [Rhodococcus erythropolis]
MFSAPQVPLDAREHGRHSAQTERAHSFCETERRIEVVGYTEDLVRAVTVEPLREDRCETTRRGSLGGAR